MPEMNDIMCMEHYILLIKNMEVYIMSEKIAVIMTAYNEKPEWVTECVESVLGQTYENIRLYVLLDNPDNDELKKLLQSYSEKNNNILFYQNKENLGLIASLNKLLGIVTESYIARMDADDICTPERLEKEMQFLEKNNLDFVMSDCSFLYSDGKKGNGTSIPDLEGDYFNEAQAYGNVSMHSTWLLKKEVYDALGGYRDVRYCEDYEFTLRAIQQGFKLGRMSDELVVYRLRDGSITFLNAKEQFEKARLLRYMYRKNRKIADISAEYLNEKFSDYNASQKEKFATGKIKLDEFAAELYAHRYAGAVKKLAAVLLHGREGRKLFVNLFYGRSRLAAVYKRAVCAKAK